MCKEVIGLECSNLVDCRAPTQRPDPGLKQTQCQSHEYEKKLRCHSCTIMPESWLSWYLDQPLTQQQALTESQG